MAQRKQMLVIVTIVIVIIGIYLGVPLIHEYYLATSGHYQPGSGDQLIMTQDITHTLTSGSTSGTIATGGLSSNEMLAKDQDKLTKPTRALLDQYLLTKNPDLLFDLVQKLTDDGAYYTSIYLYQILLSKYPDKADHTTYLTLLLNRGNYSSGFLVEYKNTIDSLLANNSITNQDALFYRSLKTLVEGDVDTFYQQVTQLSGDYASISSDLLANVATYSEYKQAPRQYLWGLFASTLLRYGYFEPASQLAQRSLDLMPQYVLGIQVKAYSNIMTHNRKEAGKDLIQLMKLDNVHLLTYQRLYGIVLFWREEYKDAIVYLSQVNQTLPNIELVRYLGLSYRELSDYMHMAKSYRELITLYTPQAIDYYEFFDSYRRSINYQADTSTVDINPIAQFDGSLLQTYINSCKSSTISGVQYLCIYGLTLQLIEQQQIDKAMQQLITLAPHYPYDFIYGTLGDLYTFKQQSPTAQIYYQKALEATYNPGYRNYLNTKISSLANDDL